MSNIIANLRGSSRICTHESATTDTTQHNDGRDLRTCAGARLRPLTTYIRNNKSRCWRWRVPESQKKNLELARIPAPKHNTSILCNVPSAAQRPLVSPNPLRSLRVQRVGDERRTSAIEPTRTKVRSPWAGRLWGHPGQWFRIQQDLVARLRCVITPPLPPTHLACWCMCSFRHGCSDSGDSSGLPACMLWSCVFPTNRDFRALHKSLHTGWPPCGVQVRLESTCGVEANSQRARCE